MAPMPIVELVRTSSSRASESDKSRSEGAEEPEPKRLSRKVAPSGSEPVVPPMVSRIVEAAGTVRYISNDSGDL